MSGNSLFRLLRGPYNFLRPDPEEVRRLVPDFARALPPPQRIYLEDETATPLLGFPILLSERVGALRRALEELLLAEERAQLAQIRRQAYDTRAHGAAWEGYRTLLSDVTVNAASSSFGRHFPSIFWLFHSIAVSRLLKETPRRILQIDAQLGRAHGDEIKYRVFHRYLDRVRTLTYDLIHRVAAEMDEAEENVFPAILTLMGDNVLILTEDYLSHDLAELGSYLHGYLGLEARELRQRRAALATWHADQIAANAQLRQTVRHLLGTEPTGDPNELLKRPGYLSYLLTLPGYDRRTLPGPEMVKVWESLLLRLKEFELLSSLRRRVILIRRENQRLVARDPDRAPAPGARQEIVLSGATRPMDFLASWVVDPVVHRFGLVYDMTSFSEIVSTLRHHGIEAQDSSFRKIFRFQRLVNRLANNHRLKLEKYLGDGALYSGRHPHRLALVAVLLQRHYSRALAEGFPLDRGMRVALNYGAYRLLPLQGEQPGEGERYEFLGHGVVELSRLVTGKTMRDIAEVKNLLISRGYPVATVDRFFAPILHQNVDLLDRDEEERRFHAYINRNGGLVNEGIVATEAFIEQLDWELAPMALRRGYLGPRPYVVLWLEDGGEGLLVGIRKLGMASFKGLGMLAVYELVDGQHWHPAGLEELPNDSLVRTLDRDQSQYRTSSAGA